MNADGLTVREKAAQLVFPRLGSNMPPPVTAAEDLDRFKRMMDEVPVGGLIVFNGRYPQTTDALAQLQHRSTIPLLVSADMERGVGQQIRGATVFPHAMAFAAADDDALLETAARVQAREALACGIHITYSPVADVNRDPRNPIIATRAFGADPQRAGRLVRAFIRGCKKEGLLSCAKHFPGHGNTSQDSHAELPVVESSREELTAYDLVPFQAAIEEGVDLVMSAHVTYPALDPKRPATLSAPILRDLLRQEMGFRGVTVTDSLLMGAIRGSHADPGEQAAALVEAGIDILLDFPSPAVAVDGIVRDVEEGALAIERLDAAVSRVLSMKERLLARHGDRVFTSPDSVFDAGDVGSEEHGRVAFRAARDAIKVFQDSVGSVPIRAGENHGSLLAVLIKPHRTRLDADEEPFGDAIRRRFPGADFRQIGPESEPALLSEIRHVALQYEHVVVALVVKPAAWHAFGLLPEQHEFVLSLIESCRPILVSLGSPYIFDTYPGAAACVCAFSDVEASQRAVVDCLAEA